MDKTTRPIYTLPPRDPLQIERYTQTKCKGMEKGISCKWKRKKKLGSSTYIWQSDFKTKSIVRDKEGHYITIKGLIQQDDITLANIYAPTVGAPKYVKQILMDIKGDINRNTAILGDLNTSLTAMDRFCKQKINKKTAVLKGTLDQMDLIHISRAFYPQAAEYTYFSSAHGMFSRINHMLGHKTNFNKFKNIEIIPSTFSDRNAMKLEINHKKNIGKHGKIWKLNNMLLNNEWDNNKIKEEIKRYLQTSENEDITIQNLGTLGKQS